MRYFLGIDPGASGAAVVLNSEGVVCSVVRFKGLTRQDFIRRMDEIDEDCDYGLTNLLDAAIEKVGPMPKQGVKSMFTFGGNNERVWMFCAIRNIRTREVRPVDWQKCVGVGGKIPKGERKKRHKEKAQELFPGQTITDDTADAFLIAEWLRRQEVKP